MASERLGQQLEQFLIEAQITISNLESLSDSKTMPMYLYGRLYKYPPQAPSPAYAQQAASQWSTRRGNPTQTHSATFLPQTRNLNPAIVLAQLRAAIWVFATFIVQTNATIWFGTSREHCLRLLYKIRYNPESQLYTSQELRELVSDIFYEQLPYLQRAITWGDITFPVFWPMKHGSPTKMH